jgi:DNA-binding protein HU-beta
VNKRELVIDVAARTGLPVGDVARVVDAVLASITRAVTVGEKVVLSGFGTFHRQARARRTARNIAAGRTVTVPATSLPAFRPGKPFREAVARRRRRRSTKAAGPAPASASRRSRSTSRRGAG